MESSVFGSGRCACRQITAATSWRRSGCRSPAPAGSGSRLSSAVSISLLEHHLEQGQAAFRQDLRGEPQGPCLRQNPGLAPRQARLIGIADQLGVFGAELRVFAQENRPSRDPWPVVAASPHAGGRRPGFSCGVPGSSGSRRETGRRCANAVASSEHTGRADSHRRAGWQGGPVVRSRRARTRRARREKHRRPGAANAAQEANSSTARLLFTESIHVSQG